ncbi:hypothetical protein [Paraburkholderia heleia]|uniref:hypothetical protein n=1 Tax=Paraburkholderia heleia TaxID=634127 RepID=UPI0031D708D8
MNAFPTTRNAAWGFYGTMGEHAGAAWPLAIQAVSGATGTDVETVRAFLDSCHGRHLAGAVHNGLARRLPLRDAITGATQEWMRWRIGRKTSRQHGIPHDLPCLTGFVIHCGILADDASEA